jgi:5-formyltetrahydrofolate cyclo-ligase
LDFGAKRGNFMTAAQRSTDLLEMKRRCRTQANKARVAAHASVGETAGLTLAHAGLPVERGKNEIVSGFFPFKSEITVLPLLAKLASEGWTTSLPVVTGEGEALRFRAWMPGEPTRPGVWDIPIPLDSAAEVTPDVLLVPMLAYDRRGYRLGYGGGYYDRTLAGLRALKPILAIGIAYAGQEIAEVPHGSWDEPLDWIMTERGAFQAERR